MSQNNKKIEIVILGGGLSGASLAYRLSSSLQLPSTKYNLTLVNGRDFAQHLLAGARAVATDEGNLEDWSLVPYDNIFGPGKTGSFKQGIAEHVDLDKRVIRLDGGEELKYDYLVLATGSKWDGFLDIPLSRTKDEAISYIKEWRKKISNASSICVVGGGAVGIETATEIKFYHPSMEVTLVHSDALLTNAAYPDKFRKALAEKLRSLGIKLILGDYIEVPEVVEGQQTVKTRNGVTVTADLWLSSRGPKPNTSYLPSSILTAQNRVKVLPTLQVQGYPNVFATADIIDWPEQKTYAKTREQLEVLAPNILNVVGGGQQKMKEYKGGLEAIFITANKTGGRAYVPLLWGIVVGDWVVSTIKSKTLFVDMVRTALGAPPVR